MVVNGWTEKIEELEKENKGYETAYTRAVLKNDKLKIKNQKLEILAIKGERGRRVIQHLKTKAKKCKDDNKFDARVKQIIRKMIYQAESRYKNNEVKLENHLRRRLPNENCTIT